MEKRFILAFALSLLILLVYPYFLQRVSPPQTTAPSRSEEARLPLPREIPVEETQAPTPPEEPVHEVKAGYEDPVYTATLTSRGGGFSSLSLKPFAHGITHGHYLMEENQALPSGFSTRLFQDGVWKEGTYALEKNEARVIEWSASETGAFRMWKRFRLEPGRYLLSLEVEAENITSEPETLQYELVVPLFVADTPEKYHMDLEADYVAAAQFEVKPARQFAKQPFLKEGPVDWVAAEKKYFTLIVKPEGTLEHVRSTFDGTALTHHLKPMPVSLDPGARVRHRYLIYAGPKEYRALKEPRLGFERILHTRFLGGLWIYFLMLLNLFYKVFHNYGFAIIVLSSLIKLAFAPLTHMSFESMRKMQALQPKLKALQEQYKKDPQRLNQEVMQLYKKNKVNPFGGCLPLFLQMPIFVALYQTFSYAMELRGAPFVWWIRDLSEPDQMFLLPFSLPFLGNQVNILPLIMMGTMLWQQKLTPQTVATKEQEMMMLLMPVLFGFIFYSLPSGLVIYWIINNLLTIFHQLFIKKLHIGPAA